MAINDLEKVALKNIRLCVKAVTKSCSINPSNLLMCVVGLQISIGRLCFLKLFDIVYAKYKDIHEQRYAFAITEVAVANTRSLRAHERVGFEVSKTYTDSYHID